MSKKLQFFATFLCIVTTAILLGFIQPAYAAIIDRSPGDQWYWKLNTTTGVLEIRLKDNNTGTGGLAQDYTSKSDWNQIWYKSGEITSDVFRTTVKKVVFTNNALGHPFNFKGHSIAYMFQDFINLEEIDFGNAKIEVKSMRSMFENCPKLRTINFGNGNFEVVENGDMNAMFKGCSVLTKVDLSSLKSNGKVYDMSNMFYNCTSLDTVILNNPQFKTRSSTAPVTSSGGMKMKNMFSGCNSLKYVDMSNITIYGRITTGNTDWVQVKGLFQNLPLLEEVYFHNTKFPNVADFSDMFSGCPNLRKVEMTGTNIAADAASMFSMFKNCYSLDTLDVSGLGKLNRIVNMDDFVKGCTGLRYLNINTLDNSRIKPTNSNHSASDDDALASTLNIDWGRELGIESCSSLEKLVAENSNVWMCYNKRGVPGSEYFDASSEGNIFYFTKKQMSLTAKGKTVTIATKRDYIDLITDRDGTAENMPKLVPSGTTFPDALTNINMANGDLNTNGAGHLPAGVYTILPWPSPAF